MRILEVRDGFLKFEADKSIYLSSFIQIDGLEKSYIAQVIQLKRSGENSIGYAKILFLYDGSLQSYDKTLPSKDSEIKEFTFDILSNSIEANSPIVIGKTQGSDLNITIDESAFNKKMLISVDDKEANNIFVRNLVKQFNNLSKNIVIIDTLGIINAKKVVAGVDFKLPLDTASLAFMYQDCLNDATADSKSMIVDIFKDLSEYSQTVPFVPFETLKTIVDDMVDKSHIFKLLVLKNKLAKFDKLGYFAKNKKEVDALKHFLNSKCTIIDISKLDSAFQNRYLSFIYETLSTDSQVLLEVSNTISKKNIKDILSSNVATTFITHSKFKYLNDIKNVFDNFVIVPSLTNNEVFHIYNTFLKTMSNNTYLIAGEATNYIPFVSQLKVINDVIEIPQEDETILENIVHEDFANEVTNDAKEEHEKESNVVTSEAEETPLLEDNLIIEEEAELENEELEEEQPEDAIVEPQISKEEILANIEEKSNDVISKATEGLVIPPTENMFDDEVEEEVDKEEDNDGNVEVVTPEIVEELPEENLQELEPEITELSEEDLEEPAIIEENELTEYSTEVHQNEEIQDYVPQEIETTNDLELEEFSELTLDNDEQISEIGLDTETGLEELTEIEDTPETLTELDGEEKIVQNEEENSIELDADIDLDLDDSLEEENNLELDENNSPQEELPDFDTNEISVLPISDDANFDNDLEEIVELAPDDIDDNDIIVDLEEEKELDENVDEQVVKDVDKVFTTRKDDDISDSDLDFIDELNSDEEGVLEELQDDSTLEELSEDNDGILEEINDAPPVLEEVSDEANKKADEEQEILQTRNSSTPIVPVYDAEIPQEDLVMSDPIQQGDTVVHAKYGSGVVEKMIKYGNKTLFSINFDNIGRRLLDPTLTEIKKA